MTKSLLSIALSFNSLFIFESPPSAQLLARRSHTRPLLCNPQWCFHLLSFPESSFIIRLCYFSTIEYFSNTLLTAFRVLPHTHAIALCQRSATILDKKSNLNFFQNLVQAILQCFFFPFSKFENSQHQSSLPSTYLFRLLWLEDEFAHPELDALYTCSTTFEHFSPQNIFTVVNLCIIPSRSVRLVHSFFRRHASILGNSPRMVLC